jgi:hypothetical protein
MRMVVRIGSDQKNGHQRRHEQSARRLTNDPACRRLLRAAPPSPTAAALVPALLVAAMTSASAASAIELVPGDSIQDAIDDPATLDGDEIVLAPGTYVETIDLRGRALTLRSTNPDDPAVVAATILDGGGMGTVVSCFSGEGPGTVLAGLTVRGGAGMSGGGMYVDGSSPTIVQCTFTDNASAFEGGGIASFFGDPLIVNCRFVRNTAFFGGGAAILGGVPRFVNCAFAGNAATGTGGAIDVFGGGAPMIAGCVMTANAAGEGGALSSDGSDSSVVSSILWRNVADVDPEVRVAGAGTASFRACDVAGSGGSAAWASMGLDGGGNIDADPMFVGALGSDGVAGSLDDDLRLRDASPCVDAGATDRMPADDADLDRDGDRLEPLPLDLARNPRVSGAAVDMGPFEVQVTDEPEAPPCPCDLTGDGRVSGGDLVIVLRSLIRRDGAYDFHDMLALLSDWGPCPDQCPARSCGRGKSRGVPGHGAMKAKG